MKLRYVGASFGVDSKGKTPDGYTWHHNVKTGEMQLVDSELHKKTAHTGGKYLWGVVHPIVN